MGQSLKAVLQLSLIAFFMTAFCAWVIPEHPDAVTWALRCILPIVTLAILWVLIRDMRRKETLQDMLCGVAPNYFERNGLCFAFIPSVSDGVCLMNLFFQNRYEKPCRARVVLQRSQNLFRIGGGSLPGIDVDVECDGAAFGVVRIPWPVPADLQGQSVKCDIACDTSYPGGRGKLLRFREGLRAGAAGGGAARAAVTGGLLLVGIVSISRPATISMTLPTGVTEELPPGAELQTEILWRLPDAGAMATASP